MPRTSCSSQRLLSSRPSDVDGSRRKTAERRRAPDSADRPASLHRCPLLSWNTHPRAGTRRHRRSRALEVSLDKHGQLEPDAGGESGRRLEELDPPGQLPGDPEAGADSLAWREIAGCGVVEAGASVDDLADESSSDATDTDFLDAAAVLHRVVRNLGGGEQQVE